MLEILAIVGGVVVVLIAAVLIFAATQPSAFRIQRSATIQAPPEKVFSLVEDFHAWKNWSPWEKLDPNLSRTYSGAERGKGAVYEWQGNKKVGQGRMEITDAAVPNRVAIQLDFIKPFEAHNVAEFTLTGQGSTTITWAMIGQKPFLFKVISLFMNMDKMIGKDFEAGLANLKGLAEQSAKQPA
jgi:uncharacterized protein YndB with AHSA1/START domain